MSNGMKKIEGDRNTTLTHDFIVGHKYEVVVRAVGPDGTEQAMESAARNTIVIAGKITEPTTPAAPTTSGFLNAISLVWTNSPDYDFDHMEVWRAISGDRDDAAKIAEVKGITYLDAIGFGNVSRYYWIRAVNTTGLTSDFSARAIGTSLGVAATDIDDFAITASKMFTNTIILSGDAWTNNSPVAGSVAWNAHNLVYGGNYYLVAAGNTALRYITWTVGNTGGVGTVADPYLTTYVGGAAYVYATSRYNIAVNEGGINQLVWNSSANMVIGSAFILDAAIVEAKIGLLAVTNAKIYDLDVDKLTANAASTNEFVSNTAQIKNAIITNAKITALAVDKLTAGTITSKIITLATAGGADCAILAGKTAFDNVSTGFILGIDDATPKFYIGSSTKYMNWDGAALTIRGTLNADDMVAGTLSVDRIGATSIAVAKLAADVVSAGKIVTGLLTATNIQTGILTGRTVQTDTGAAGHYKRIVLDVADNTLRMYDATNVNILTLDDDIYGSMSGMDIGNAAGGVVQIAKTGTCYSIHSQMGLGVYIDEAVSGLTSPLWIDDYYAAATQNVIVVRRLGFSKLVISSEGYVDTLAYKVSTVKVIGAQGAAVADATDAADVILRLNDLLARCRAHGLIAT